jgi:hypothetical protein
VSLLGEQAMLATSTEALLSESLSLLTAALELLDRADAPGDIGAHVDHARERTAEILRTLGSGSSKVAHSE